MHIVITTGATAIVITIIIILIVICIGKKYAVVRDLLQPVTDFFRSLPYPLAQLYILLLVAWLYRLIGSPCRRIFYPPPPPYQAMEGAPALEVNEYEKFLRRMNPPRVSVDNESCETATLVKVDSVNRPGILLDVVQVLADLDLSIRKAYISSDGGWFMEVFYVTDSEGNKLTDETRINCMVQTITVDNHFSRRVGVQTASEHTAIELTGPDRPGLLSEIFALLTELKCNVVSSELWTHNNRVACLIHVADDCAHGPIQDDGRLYRIKEALYNVLKGHTDTRAARTDFASSVTHVERRLHQMMFADRDYETLGSAKSIGGDVSLTQSPGNPEVDKVTVDNCDEKGYSVVNIECRNRPKLLFDAVCTLTDMGYVVFHATIDCEGLRAYQEYYIRHRDGCPLNSEAERQRLIQCLRAAIERRVPEGLRLELCTRDRVGLLSEVTRIFREYGLSVTKAGVTTRGDRAVNVFYVTDAAGNPASSKVIEQLQKEIGKPFLQVKDDELSREETSSTKVKFSLGNLFGRPTQALLNLGLMKSFI